MPSTSAVNFTPTWTAEASVLLATCGVDESGQIVQGQMPGSGSVVEVVKLHE